MIIITLDHSYDDDYHMISEIEVMLEDKEEEERIIHNFKRIDGALVDVDRMLRQRIADALEVDVNLVELDTNDIDIY